MKQSHFTKYEQMGAYHWEQCDVRSRTYNPPLHARYDVLVGHLDACRRVLDVGCGDGYLMSRISPFAENVVGIEFEEEGVKLAFAQLRPFANSTVVRGDCYHLPFKGGSFDVVVMADVVEHLGVPERSLSEIARVLTGEGKLVLTTPMWRADRIWDSFHVKEFTPEELKAQLYEHFEDVELGFFWPRYWYDLYATAIGSRLMRCVGRLGFNPYVRQGRDEATFFQMIARCMRPRGRVAERSG